MKKFTFSLLALGAALALRGVAQTPSAAPAVPAASAADVATAVATPDAAAVRSAIDLFRADLQHEKALIISQHIWFTSDERAEFWPLYNEYNAALNQLLDERLVLLKDYVAIHDKMTNEQASDLADRLFAWEGKRTHLKQIWFMKFAEVIPARKAAQFFQIDNQINAALDLQLMDALPLIGP